MHDPAPTPVHGKRMWAIESRMNRGIYVKIRDEPGLPKFDWVAGSDYATRWTAWFEAEALQYACGLEYSGEIVKVD